MEEQVAPTPTAEQVRDTITEYDDTIENMRFESIGHPAWLKVVEHEQEMCQRIGRELIAIYNMRGPPMEQPEFRDTVVRRMLTRHLTTALKGEEE